MSALANPPRCPDCGTELGSDPATEGICPRCLLSLALLRSPPEAVVDRPGGPAQDLAGEVAHHNRTQPERD